MTISVVVLGGGYSGIEFAQEFTSIISPEVAHVTVVDKLNFTFHHDAIPRALVERSFVPKLFVPTNKAISTNATFVHGIVEAINSHELVVRCIENDELAANTTHISFDYLVIASGSTYPAPIKVPSHTFSRESIEAAIYEAHDHIAAAQSVLVVGGGSVGCEVAGEIAVAYPNKKVTLVDGNDHLIANAKMNDEFRQRLLDELKKYNVQVILGQRPKQHITKQCYEHKSIELTKGTKIVSDVQLICAGMVPNTSLIKELDINLVTPKGLKVKPSMELDDDRYSHIYVIGDASNHPSPKTAHIAGDQAEFLAHGLAAKIQNGTPMKDFSSGPTEGLMVPIGPEGGVAQLLDGRVEGSWLVIKKKHKDYNTGRIWSEWNASIPE
ncbi:pyridine nucleotide-disulfide oxidoreductase [Thraustotheca clavata]|uniref:Pyridine nucleotide-disulfide oxidoreductase n=1 Tax=Thraustotheca clavata TaxID=74557 RepID=A0A1V9ZFT2_9STRA|nr:pyridine nucleotide-disulfide oxidoreductase [Thraustotheca clavata]